MDLKILTEIMQTGFVVGIDEELGIVVTANGSYFNVYDTTGRCIIAVARSKNFYMTTAAELWDEVELILKDIKNGV